MLKIFGLLVFKKNIMSRRDVVIALVAALVLVLGVLFLAYRSQGTADKIHLQMELQDVKREIREMNFDKDFNESWSGKEMSKKDSMEYQKRMKELKDRRQKLESALDSSK